jgi:CheY-like chemotaxis protein
MGNADSSTDGPHRSILVVDDDAAIRTTMQRLLRNQPVNVSCVDSGAAALDLLADGLRPDLILLDIDMPGMNGWQVVERLKQNPALAPIPVVVVSGAHRSGNVDGVVSFLPKPFSFTELLAVIRDHAAPA